MKYALIALLLSAFCGNAQTIKTLGYNTTNGNVVAATNLTFTNPINATIDAGESNSTVFFSPIFFDDIRSEGIVEKTRTNLGGTTTGNAVFTATNAAAARNAIGLGTFSSEDGYSRLYGQVQDEVLNTEDGVTLFREIYFSGTNAAAAAAITRTNLSLGQFKDAVGDNWAELYDNGELRLVAGNTIIFFEAFDFGGTNAANFREQSRTSLGLGATWLTNTDAASFRTAIGLGTAATSSASAFQPSSTVLTNLAANNGGSLTNLTAANIVGTVGLASNITGTAPLATNVTGIVAIANGGTGANSAGGARTNLGLGTGDIVTFNRVIASDFTGTLAGNVNLSGGQSISFVSGGNPATTRTNLGLGATWLTNTDAASFRTAIGLGTAATNPSTAFQPSSANLTNLAANNGGSLTNLTAANIVGTVGLASNITGTAPLASNVTGIVALANGGTGATNAATARTSLGATTVGASLFTLQPTYSIRFLRINADNTASALSDSEFRTAIGLGTAATNPSTAFQPASSALTNLAANNGASLTNIPISGVVNLQTSLNTKLATNGSAAGLTNFPTLNQNTTGTASNVTGVVAIANGGTGANSAGGARTNLGFGWSALTNTNASTSLLGVDASGQVIADTGTNALTLTKDTTIASSVGAMSISVNDGAVAVYSGPAGENILIIPPDDVPVFSPFYYWNDPSIRSSFGFSTNLNSFWTSTSVGAARTNLGLGTTNAVTFDRLQLNNASSGLTIGGMQLTAPSTGLDLAFLRTGTTNMALTTNGLVLHVGSYSFSGGNTTGAAITRTNLGLGATWLTNTSAANFRSDIGLGFSSSVQFDNLSISTLALANDGIILFDGDDAIQISDVIHLWKPLTFDTLSVAATTRTNLGLGATNNVTFNNITANGSANTAPNQTIASGSSIITRDLMFTAQTDDPSGDLIPGANATGTSGFPAQAGTHIVNGLFAQVTTNANGSAGAYFVDDQWTHANYSGASMPANKAIDMTLKGVMLRVETNQNWVLRVVAGVGSPNRVPPRRDQDALSARGWGVNFFYNGTNHVYEPFWYTTNYNVGPQTVVSNLSAASWLGRVYTMRMRQETNGDIKFWINDGLGSRLTATPSWQTNVTWGATTFGGRHMAIEAASATNAAPAVQARIHYRVGYIKYEP